MLPLPKKGTTVAGTLLPVSETDAAAYGISAVYQLSLIHIFIVSQRAASLQHADQIIVLDDGRMVGLGRHAELLESCPVYKEIYESQFKKGDAQKDVYKRQKETITGDEFMAILEEKDSSEN